MDKTYSVHIIEFPNEFRHLCIRGNTLKFALQRLLACELSEGYKYDFYFDCFHKSGTMIYSLNLLNFQYIKDENPSNECIELIDSIIDKFITHNKITKLMEII